MALSLEKADNLTYQRYGRSTGQVPPTQLMRPWMDGLMGVFAIRKSDRNLVHEISRSCPVDDDRVAIAASRHEVVQGQALS